MCVIVLCVCLLFLLLCCVVVRLFRCVACVSFSVFWKVCQFICLFFVVVLLLAAVCVVCVVVRVCCFCSLFKRLNLCLFLNMFVLYIYMFVC